MINRIVFLCRMRKSYAEGRVVQHMRRDCHRETQLRQSATSITIAFSPGVPNNQSVAPLLPDNCAATLRSPLVHCTFKPVLASNILITDLEPHRYHRHTQHSLELQYRYPLHTSSTQRKSSI
jgi:hypothetical protein